MWLLPGPFFFYLQILNMRRTQPSNVIATHLNLCKIANTGNSCSTSYCQQGAESLLQAKSVPDSEKNRKTKRSSEELNALLRPTGCWFASHPITSYWGHMTQEMAQECLGGRLSTVSGNGLDLDIGWIWMWAESEHELDLDMVRI